MLGLIARCRLRLSINTVSKVILKSRKPVELLTKYVNYRIT